MKANIPPFYVGQKVTNIHSCEHYPKGTIIIVSFVEKCQCGIYHIGDNTPYSGSTEIRCSCGNVVSPDRVPPYYSWEHYDVRAIEEQLMPLLTFEKIKEKEKEEVLCLN